ncbi:MAG: cupin domain-containing protein [Acidobacteriota bacterium]
MTTEPLSVFGEQITVKLSGAATGGQYAVMEVVTQPKSGPPLHLHQREEESFHVLEGEFTFQVDGRRLSAGPGCSVYVPRGAAHAFRNVGTEPGRMLLMVKPSGLENSFAELSGSTGGQREPDMSVVIPILRKHGMALLGLPLED